MRGIRGDCGGVATAFILELEKKEEQEQEQEQDCFLAVISPSDRHRLKNDRTSSKQREYPWRLSKVRRKGDQGKHTSTLPNQIPSHFADEQRLQPVEDKDEQTGKPKLSERPSRPACEQGAAR